MNAEDLARALDAKPNGKGWRARCPAHDDTDPSFDISAGSGGKALFVCRAGCTQDAVIAALTARGLWQNGNTNGPRNLDAGTAHLNHPQIGAPDETFEYHDPAGKVIGAACRWNTDKGKEIRPAIREAGKWRWKAFDEPRPLYGLPALAAHSDKPVLIVEGEKTAEAARELIQGHAVTTWPGGTGGVGMVDLGPLKGRDVVLWPDADDPGKKAMRALADRLTEARSVKGVKLPEGLPKAWDLADTIPFDLDPDQLIAEAVNLATERLSELKLTTAADLVAAEFTEPNWAIPDILPDGCAILAGKPKTGKSWLALDFAVAVASGGAAMGNVECEQGDVLALLLEDTARRLSGRLKAVLQGADAPSRLHIATEWKKTDNGGLADIAAWLQAHPDARLVVIDTLALIRGKPDRDEGVYAGDYAAASAIKKVADDAGVALVLIHHLRKESGSDPLDQVSGTAGLTGAVDTIAVLKREPNDLHGILYIRGRDVHEQEIALEFDKDTGRWANVGSGAEFRMSEERKAVRQALRDTREAMTPAAIARELGKSGVSVRRLLGKMVAAGEISKLTNGKYYCAD